MFEPDPWRGYANQQLGIVSALALALLSERALLIHGGFWYQRDNGVRGFGSGKCFWVWRLHTTVRQGPWACVVWWGITGDEGSGGTMGACLWLDLGSGSGPTSLAQRKTPSL